VELNTFHRVSVERILSAWFPGDYIPIHESDSDTCYSKFGYHKCCDKPLSFKWNYVLDQARNDDRYEDVYLSVKRHGLVAPLGAKQSDDGHIVLVDGHHRMASVLDLALSEVPVYVGDSLTEVFDLRALDSNWWRKSSKSVDSPWLVDYSKWSKSEDRPQTSASKGAGSANSRPA
jgi:ParB-like nuclease family protein